MAELATLARPYAEAVFDLAIETDSLDEWSNNLNFLTAIIDESTMAAVIANPKVNKNTLSSILLDICDEHLDAFGKNLVKMLVDNHRLLAIPQIARQYEQLKAQHYQHIKVEIISAYPVEPPQQQEIEAILQKHYHKAIDINTQIDKSLLGGWLIRAGDQVIDISVKGRIQQLASELRG